MPVVHEEKLRVNWVDTDASGRIHYTAALRYFEIAEHGLMRRLMGGATPAQSGGFGLPRVHVEADYKLALRYPDEFTCSARVAHVGSSSASYAYEIRNPAGELCIAGKIVVVATDPLGRKQPLPPLLREALEKGI
ncbi:MAG TPA: thioesterase family protein [Myxococcota bacterium]|nr:thioesterase family protein [Myxococcota bacterium]